MAWLSALLVVEGGCSTPDTPPHSSRLTVSRQWGGVSHDRAGVPNLLRVWHRGSRNAFLTGTTLAHARHRPGDGYGFASPRRVRRVCLTANPPPSQRVPQASWQTVSRLGGGVSHDWGAHGLRRGNAQDPRAVCVLVFVRKEGGREPTHAAPSPWSLRPNKSPYDQLSSMNVEND